MTQSIQERFAPSGRCFGCGPANAKGLRIRSIASVEKPDELVCDWTPEPHHEAFEGVLNGGIVGALLDCHSNWTGAMALMKARGDNEPPCTVTSEFHVKLRRPTPSGKSVHLVARPTEVRDPVAVIEAELWCDGKKTATCTGTFVAVGPDHPAYHRW
jgi:acyl-coenzyme A thioesterase PaaI-like protein